jgi:hypothetical protein
MIDPRHATGISDVRNFRGAECNTDHFLVRVKMKQRSAVGKKVKEDKVRRFNTVVLVNEEIRAKCDDKYKHVLTINYVEECWTNIKTSIKPNA